MALTAFIAQFMGYFLLLMGGVSLLKRKTIEKSIRSVLRNRGTLLIVGFVDVIMGLLLVLAHPSWNTLTDKAVSALSWFLLLEGIFYALAGQKQIRVVLKFLHNESVYYTLALAYVVVGAALVFGM